jgi:prepilin-type N-terminal cleavage/methylation domain-containing protein
MIAKGVMIMQGYVGTHRRLNRKFNQPSKNSIGFSRYNPERGYTLIEVMTVLVIVAIAVLIAMPSFSASTEKRELVGAAEQLVSFMEQVQGQAIKQNQKVTVSWSSPGSHNVNWCIGASLPPKTAPCDCTETVATEADFCSIDSVPYRLVQSDFVDINYEFLHMQPTSSNFAFDPVRGIVTDVADAESVDGDWLFYIHSDSKQNGKRRYELELSMFATGRMSICAEDSSLRSSIIGGYPVC